PEKAGEPSPHKSEGAYYLWRDVELDALLGADSQVVKLRFGIQPDGHAPQDPQQEFTGKNLLYVARTIDEVAQQTTKNRADVSEILNRTRLQMFEARLQRPRPHRAHQAPPAWH